MEHDRVRFIFLLYSNDRNIHILNMITNMRETQINETYLYEFKTEVSKCFIYSSYPRFYKES
jgi:hypothetical protein